MLLVFELTYACPFRCPHCSIRRADVSVVPLSVFEDVVRCFKSIAGSKAKLVISGGEPSIIPNLDEYVGLAKKHGFIVTVATAVYNEEVLEKAKPDWYQVSIDYYGEKHDRWRGMKGLFNKAISFVLRHPNAFVRSVAMKNNIDDIIKIKKLVGEERLVLALPVRGLPMLEPTTEQLNVLRKHGVIVANACPAGRNLLAITPKLEIIPCIFYRKPLAKYNTCSDLLKALELGRRLKPFPCISVN